MKKILTILVAVVLLTACADPKVLDGFKYETYGLFDSGEYRSDCVDYSASIGNIVWGVILVETIVAPVIIFGFETMEPIRLKPNCNDSAWRAQRAWGWE